MHALRILPLLLVAMTYQAAAQSTVEATSGAPRVVQDDGRLAPRPVEVQACGLSLQACPTEDRNRVLLFLSVVSGGKRPLILR